MNLWLNFLEGRQERTDDEQAHIHNVISRFDAFERITQPDMLAEWLRDNPDPADAATELTRHDQQHGIYQEDQ